MKLIEKIRADRIVAFKAKENIKKNLLGCLIADACKEDKEPEDQKVLSIIKKFIDNAEFVIAQATIGETDSVKASMEIEILSEYRPKQMTDPELRLVISSYLEKTQNFKMGLVMKYLQQEYQGQYDGKLASHLLKNIYGLK
jgi:uncharacterized protein YqeY